MSRPATEADFHGVRLNNPDCLYDFYRRFPYFAERAAMIRARYPTASRVLVAGCGYGYLVDELRQLGIQAWGADISLWAIDQASQVIPATAAFVLPGDVTKSADMAAMRVAAGFNSNQRFGLAVTEDVLTVLDDAEIPAALAAVRGVASNVLHIVTPGNWATPGAASGVNWKPIGQWKTLCAPDPVLDAEQGRIA